MKSLAAITVVVPLMVAPVHAQTSDPGKTSPHARDAGQNSPLAQKDPAQESPLAKKDAAQESPLAKDERNAGQESPLAKPEKK